MRTNGRMSIWILALGLMLLVGGAAFGAGFSRIAAGYDNWQSLGGGATRYSFGSQPIPADFFCVGSEPFRGAVEFEGVPLHTAPEGILGTTDTVIERLDVATFNQKGVAVTRIKARALNLIGTKLVSNRCGTYKVTASLAGEQPVTRLTYYRENAYGGSFDADLRLRVQVSFTEVKSGEVRTLVRTIAMPTVNRTPFAFKLEATEDCASTTEPANPEAPGSGDENEEPVFGGNEQDIVLLDGHTADRTERNGGFATKLSPRPEVLTLKTNNGSTFTGTAFASSSCRCNSSGQCLPVYSWHQPDCQGGLAYDCELHFTTPPCQVYNFSNCPPKVQASQADQLRILRDRGFIHEDPAALIQKQIRSADQIRADQEHRLAEQIRAAEKQ